MADPITQFKLREARNLAQLGEGVQVQSHAGDVCAGRAERRSRRRAPSPVESPPESPAAARRRQKRMQASGDVFSILGISKPEDWKEAEARKQALMSGVAARLMKVAMKSPAEQSKSKWSAVARLLKRGRLTLAHYEIAEKRARARGPVPSPSPAKKQPGPKAAFSIKGGSGYKAEVRCEFRAASGASSSTVRGARQCVVTRWSASDAWIAAGFFDGSLLVYDLERREILAETSVCALQQTGGKWVENHEEDPSLSAVTNLRWCPTGNRRVPSTCLAVTATGGILALYDVNSRSGLSLINATQDAEDEYYGVDWTCDAQKIVVGGRGFRVKVYNRELELVFSSWEEKWEGIAGHTNRIMAVRAHPQVPSTIFSAGFDSTLQVWDLREGKQVMAAGGPLVESDVDLDSSGIWMLTASTHSEHQLEVWDTRTMTKAYGLMTAANGDPGCSPTCAAFSKDDGSRFLHVAGMNENLARVFLRTQDGAEAPVVATATGPAVFRSLSSSNDGWSVAYGDADGTVTVCEITQVGPVRGG